MLYNSENIKCTEDEGILKVEKGKDQGIHKGGPSQWHNDTMTLTVFNGDYKSQMGWNDVI